MSGTWRRQPSTRLGTGGALVPSNAAGYLAEGTFFESPAGLRPHNDHLNFTGETPTLTTVLAPTVGAVVLAGTTPTLGVPTTRPWNPTDLFGINIVARYKAQASSMTLSGSTVTAWADIGPNGLHLTGASAPQYSATARNSLPGVTLNGTSDYLVTASSALFPQGTTPHTIVTIIYHSTDDGGFHPSVAWGQLNFNQLRQSGTHANNVGQFGYASDHESAFDYSNRDRIAIHTLASGGSPTSTIWVEASATSSTFTMSDRGNTDSVLYIGFNGGAGGANDLFTGIIQEVIVLDNVVTTTQIELLQGYAAWEWGQQANLYSGHTYASAAPTVEPPGCGAITLSGQLATLAGGGSTNTLTPTVGAVTLAGQSPALTTTLTPTVGAVTLTGQAPALTTTLTPTVGAITLAGQTAVVTQATVLTPTVGAITLAGQSPALTTTATATVGAITLAGQTPALTTTLAPAVGSVTLTGQTPTVTLATALVPTSGSITLAGQAAALVGGLNPAAGSITLAGQSPALLTTLTATVGAITLAGQQPAIGAALQPASGAITLAGQSPALTTVETATVGSVAVTGLSPPLTTILSPAVGAVTIAGQTPTFASSNTLTPTVGAVTLAGQTPVLVTIETAAVGSVTLAGQQPTLTLTTVLTPSAGSVTLAGQQAVIPGITILTPTVGAITLAGQGATLTNISRVVDAFVAVTGQTPTFGLTGPSYRYYRMYVTANQGDGGCQLSELQFLDSGGARITASATATEPGGSNPGGETPAQAIDGDVNTKIYDGSFGSNGNIFNLIVDFGATQTIYGYRWYTANDSTGRDPTTWLFQGSPDGTTWTTLDSVSGYAPTATRNVLAYTTSLGVSAVSLDPLIGAITLAGQTPTVTQAFTLTPASGAITVAGQQPSITNNVTLAPSSGAITLAGQAARLQLNLSPAVGAVTLAGQTPVVTNNTLVAPSTGAITLVGLTPGVVNNVTLAPTVGAITLAGQQVFVARGLNPASAAITVAGQTAGTIITTVTLPISGRVVINGTSPYISGQRRLARAVRRIRRIA